MNSDPNIFDCLLDPSEMFDFYQKIGTVLRNDRDIANENIRGQALRNTLLLLQSTAMIQYRDEEYTKLSSCQTYDSFFATLIACINNTYADEVATIINCNKHYDESKNQFFIYVNDIPLKYMGLAMLMEQTGEFERIINREYFIGIKNYTNRIKKKRLVSIEELHNKLLQDVEHGEQAERFALKYEITRLKQLGINKEPLIISSFDVTAGYDMVSYESKLSESYDRFVEVKSVSNDLEFFWSANEYRVAKRKGEKYYLYLVELKNIKDSSYSPIIISDPANNIMQSENWLVEPHNYHIKKL